MNKEKSKGQTSTAVKVLAFTIMLLFTFALLEIASYAYLRIFEGYDGEHLITYDYDDYKIIHPARNYHNTKGVHHNAQGFRRDEDTPMSKNPGSYRIFIMGGSTAYGLQSLSAIGKEKYSVIRNDETIDYYLEKYLNREIPDRNIEVINAAITSHYSHHHLIYLNQTILKYDPDMVIFIDGFNDYFPYKKGFDQFRDYAYQERSHIFMGKPTFTALSGFTGWWLFRKSHFVYLAGKTLRPIWLGIGRSGRERAQIDVQQALINLSDNAKRNFIKMVERNSIILKHEGVIPVFALQPEIVFEQSKKFSDMEKQIFEEMNEHWQVNYVEFKNKAKPIVTEYLVQATAKTGSFFIDMTDVFAGFDEDGYTDYCHLTPGGNKWLAEDLGEKILPVIRDDIK